MSNDKIANALMQRFEKHRIVFWYDTNKELRDDYKALDLPDVKKIELKNNEFKVKYQVLRENTKQKFLLYHEGPQPSQLDNWLLDVLLSHDEFRTDQVAIWLNELGLSRDDAAVVQEHHAFFNSGKRREQLKNVLKKDDTPGMVRLKMLGVCTGIISNPKFDVILESLLTDEAEGKSEKIKLINRCSLELFLWEQLKRHYGYIPENPSIKDFVIELFKSCYAMETEGDFKLSTDALVFLKRWKDSRTHEDAFEKISNDCSGILNIEESLFELDYRKLIDLDYFEAIDMQILRGLVADVSKKNITAGECAQLVRQRRQSHWCTKFSNLYSAIDSAAQFLNEVDSVNLSIESMAEGIKSYTNNWYRIDQLYRKFIYHVRESAQPTLLGGLIEEVENKYSNSFLLPMNNNWQKIVDRLEKWDDASITLQRNLYSKWVQPFVIKKTKVCVVISDAMRYEIGEELLSRVRQEDRFEASLEPALSMLPSYTQLGMAALLPNETISLAENKNTHTISVDGINAQGTPAKAKILKSLDGIRSSALKSEDLMKLNGDECRELVREHDIVYIYHNKIDATGDKRDSEEGVFKAAEDTLTHLVKLVKKLASANATNLLITADHGFIYQDRAIEESDFLAVEPEGKKILLHNRRFVLGFGLKEQSSLRKFSASELGFKSDIEVQIPKSINRLRVRGAGSRFVHGGASLQEVIIPVVQINKKRKSDIRSVDVEILKGSTSIITSGQLSVVFYQKEAVTDKVQARILRAGIWTKDGVLISDSHTLKYDLTSDNPRERELPTRFLLTRVADEVNNQEVVLKLEEQEGDTSHFKLYKTVNYMVRRSFSSDFDF
jgi:uncharacterized protein (TIGR02687 family)